MHLTLLARTFPLSTALSKHTAIAGRIAPWALRFASVGTLYGLYELQTNDVGLSELIARVWTA
jgi:hypothetical protein